MVIQFSASQVTAEVSEVYPKDPEAAPCGVDDMTKLAYLHEPGVLQNLKSRYDMNEIYVSLETYLATYILYDSMSFINCLLCCI